jgi:polyisoprenoid-binding protein YceI
VVIEISLLTLNKLKTVMMKRHMYTLAVLCSTLLFTSCGGEDKTAGEANKEEVEMCFYSLNTDTYELGWIAYKTTERVGVPGTFNDITMTSGESEDIMSALTSIEFEINTSSVETQNEERNGKIAEHFFGTINTPVIMGKVAEVNLEEGKAIVTITMNGISFDVPGTFTMDGDAFSYKAEIDVQEWNGVSGIVALNKVCEDLHKGDDGVSVLWQDVNISFSGSLNKDCE